jgi:hypothetical protein
MKLDGTSLLCKWALAQNSNNKAEDTGVSVLKSADAPFLGFFRSFN